jgi:hypothetical protein
MGDGHQGEHWEARRSSSFHTACPAARDPALVLELSMDGRELSLIGSVLAFDSARSPALEELRIETFLPANDHTARQLEAVPLAD